MQRRWGSTEGSAGRRAVEDPTAEGGERRLGEEEVEEEEEKWIGALSTLIDTFTTLGCALAVVLLLQLLVPPPLGRPCPCCSFVVSSARVARSTCG